MEREEVEEEREARRTRQSIEAAQKIGNAFAKIFALGAGVGLLCAMRGAISMRTYLNEFGAAWALPLVPVADLIQYGLPSVLAVAVFSFFLLFIWAVGKPEEPGFLRWSNPLTIVMLLLSAVVFPLSAYAPLAVLATYCQILAIILICFSAIWIAEFVLIVGTNPESYSPYQFGPIYNALVVLVLLLPLVSGFGQGRADSDLGRERLSAVTFPDAPSTESWRLVVLTGNGALVVRVGEQGKPSRIRVVSLDQLEVITVKPLELFRAPY